MSTYRDLTTRSMRLIGAIARNQTPSAQQSNDALDRLQELINAASGSPLMAFATETHQFTLSTGVTSYTVGPTGVFVVPNRPIRIDSAQSRDNTVAPPVDLEMTELSTTDFQNIPQKDTTGTRPYFFNYTPDYPNGTLLVYPKPNAGSFAIRISFQTALNENITLDTTVTVPPAYKKWMAYALAVSLAPEYGVLDIPSSIMQGEMNAKQTIMNNNFESEEMEFDLTSPGKFNIYSGYPVRGS
ncbi:MAG: hypothetical protein ACJ8R9_10910 [Steroidobacteraceae bacterium]